MAGTKPKQQRIKADRDSYASHGSARYIRVTARKARLIADLIRGKQVDVAMNILRFSNRPSAAPHVAKLLNSLAEEAKRNTGGDLDSLVVAKIMVDGGPTMKRIRPRAMGRAFRVMKRTCHITIGLRSNEA